MGPIARQELLDNLLRQLNESKDQGARVLYGGEVVDKLLIQPTVLVDTNTNQTCFREELFGPVFSLFKYRTEEEVIELANDTQYGLGAMVFTSNP
mmetsp:Transcript_21395/g.3482  ORF Transcript_21395/g.3482 Transcript_21395/m.3482 type:complete len:95 (+) Transcript_21395:946-1230(+)